MTRHVLMCEPIHYRIAYEINPWMRLTNAADGPRAHEQWLRLVTLLQASGVTVELIAQGPEVPDMTFTANAGIVTGTRFIPSNFRFPERQLEAERFTAWFDRHGYDVVTIHEPHYWEGEGDVLEADGTVFAGYRFRTEARAIDHVDEILEASAVRLELVDPRFYHLDTCFCPLGEGRALYYPPAFSAAAASALRASVPRLVAIPPDEALRFACNAVVADSGTVILNSGCPRTKAALASLGLRPLSTPMDEFIKAGGSVKCLLLSLDRFAQA